MKDELTREDRIDNLKGLGCSRKRVEDARFTQGKGKYVDDIKLDGMLFGDFVRSPYAHARVKGINKEAALQVPGVLAVLTADDLRPLGLHWMPTALPTCSLLSTWASLLSSAFKVVTPSRTSSCCSSPTSTNFGSNSWAK